MSYRWRKGREQPSHADDWLMTYADMITLLLCFFVIFLSVSVPKKEAQQKVQIPPPVEQTAPRTDILEGNLPFHGRAHAAQPSDQVTDGNPAQEPALKSFVPPPVLLPDAPLTVDAGGNNAETPAPDADAALDPVYAPAPVIPELPKAQIAAAAENKGSTPANDAAGSPASLPEIVDHLKAQGPATIEQKGDRITTMQVSSEAFFGKGSATLSEAGKAVLRDVATNIKSDKFKGYQVTVEGHTDDAPIKTLQFPSNWELSTARAAAVVHFFLDQGIPAQRLRAAGYADTFPVAPNRDAAGNPIPENQARNRRVVIKLEKIDKTQ